MSYTLLEFASRLLVSRLLSLPLLAISPAAFALSDTTLRHTGAATATAGYLAFCGAIWLRHRHRQQRERDAVQALMKGDCGDTAPLLIAYASQTGTAERLAWQSAEALQQAHLPVRLLPLAALDVDTLRDCQRALFIVSTYGEGDPPDQAAAFARRVMTQAPDLHRLQFGLLSLGDSSYRDYCGFGRGLGHWLRTQGAEPLFDPVEVDNGDGGALRHWQHHLGLLGGRTDLADWQSPGYGRWRLVARHCVNSGSAGAPAFFIALEPLDGDAAWEAGDIAEIGPRRENTASDTLAPLPHREYSIASLHASGRVELLVRQHRHPDGSLGLGSGYLTAIATIGDEVDLRVRSNSNFHLPENDCPLILIGNGTGIAGLRALLQARQQRDQHTNWLLFGERNAAHDYFFRDEIEQWQQSGHLSRVDLAFSRDNKTDTPIYVQQRLREAGDTLRQWVDDGAAIYICGSLQGMAPAVHAVLVERLGEETVEQLTEQGRYRRDVY